MSLASKRHISKHGVALQTFMILPKEKTTVWVKQNGNFFQQNYSVIKIEQNWACSAKSSQVARMNKNCFCSVGEIFFFLLSMLSIAYFSLLANFCKIGFTFFPTKVLVFFLCRVENVCSVMKSKVVKIEQVSTVNMIANVLTKPLGKIKLAGAYKQVHLVNVRV